MSAAVAADCGAAALRALPRALRRTSDEARPFLRTIEREKPELFRSGSICATYPLLRELSNAKALWLAVGAPRQAASIERCPASTVRTMWFGLA